MLCVSRRASRSASISVELVLAVVARRAARLGVAKATLPGAQRRGAHAQHLGRRGRPDSAHRKITAGFFPVSAQFLQVRCYGSCNGSFTRDRATTSPAARAAQAASSAASSSVLAASPRGGGHDASPTLTVTRGPRSTCELSTTSAMRIAKLDQLPCLALGREHDELVLAGPERSLLAGELAADDGRDRGDHAPGGVGAVAAGDPVDAVDLEVGDAERDARAPVLAERGSAATRAARRGRAGRCPGRAPLRRSARGPATPSPPTGPRRTPRRAGRRRARTPRGRAPGSPGPSAWIRSAWSAASSRGSRSAPVAPRSRRERGGTFAARPGSEPARGPSRGRRSGRGSRRSGAALPGRSSPGEARRRRPAGSARSPRRAIPSRGAPTRPATGRSRQPVMIRARSAKSSPTVGRTGVRPVHASSRESIIQQRAPEPDLHSLCGGRSRTAIRGARSPARGWNGGSRCRPGGRRDPGRGARGPAPGGGGGRGRALDRRDASAQPAARSSLPDAARAPAGSALPAGLRRGAHRRRLVRRDPAARRTHRPGHRRRRGARDRSRGPDGAPAERGPRLRARRPAALARPRADERVHPGAREALHGDGPPGGHRPRRRDRPPRLRGAPAAAPDRRERRDELRGGAARQPAGRVPLPELRGDGDVVPSRQRPPALHGWPGRAPRSAARQRASNC